MNVVRSSLFCSSRARIEGSHSTHPTVMRAASLCLLLVLLPTGCATPISSQDAAEMMFNQLWLEDNLVFSTCRDLSVSSPDQVALLLRQESIPEAARAEMVHEAVSGITSLFSALGVDAAVCDPAQLIGTSLSEHGLPPEALAITGASALMDSLEQNTCQAHLERLFGLMDSSLESGSSIEAAPLQLYAALRRSGVTPAQLLSDPLRIGRLIDLSPAVLYSVVYFSDQISDLTQEMSGSFGFAKGLVRLVLEQVAAELLAVTTNRLLDRLEESTLVSRASVSRGACALYEQASSRPVVTVRLLKRVILRFQPQLAGRPVVPYGAVSFCHVMSPRGVCEDMMNDLDLEDLLPESRDPMSRTRFSALNPQLPLASRTIANQEPVDFSEQLLEAASLCPPPCALQDISRHASALTFARAEQQSLPNDILQQVVHQISEGIRTDIDSLRAELEQLQQQVAMTHYTVGALVNIVREGESSAGRLRRDIVDAIMRLSNCQARWTTIRQARIDFLENVLLIDHPVFCEGGPDFYQSNRFPGVRVPAAAVCDPSHSFDFDVATDSLFETCEATPLSGGAAMLSDMALVLATLNPQMIMIIGHADERPIQTRRCLERFSNNTILSEARAQAVRSIFQDGLAGSRANISLQSTGVGDIDPRVHCGPNDSDDCHAKNRRVTMRMIGASGVSFDFSCAGGR